MVDYLSIVNSKQKPPAYEKMQEVYCTMAVHTQGASPEHIFKQRRPLEGINKDVVEYREENHRPITKDEFDKAIAGYIEAAMNLDIQIDYKNSKIKEYEPKIKLKDGIKNVSLKDWVIKRIGSYKQTDPNAVVVVLPKHPEQKFIPDYTEPKPDFNSIINKQIELEYRLISFSDVKSIDVDHIVFKAGKFKYGPKEEDKADYFFGIDKNQTYLIYPELEKKKKYIYKSFPYYKNGLSNLPAAVIGDKIIIEMDDGTGEMIEYYISDFHGAAAFGDLAVGQQSDSQLSEVRFIFPRHWVIPTKCKNDEAHYTNGKHVILKEDGTEHNCSVCNGSGVIFDASPAGSRIIDLKGELFQEGKFTTPEGFITPPVDILKHSSDRSEYYFNKMLSSLCVTNQNMTNQSAESKAIDVQYKTSRNTVIITGLYMTYLYLLNISDEYLGGRGDLEITFPEDFDVRSANDILYQLTELRANKAPAVILIEFTKKYMLKAFGDSPLNKKIMEFLSVTDKLFAYGTEDLQTIKGIYGSDITTEDIIYNTQAFPIVKEMANKDESLMKKPFNEIKAIVLAEIIKYFPTQEVKQIA